MLVLSEANGSCLFLEFLSHVWIQAILITR